MNNQTNEQSSRSAFAEALEEAQKTLSSGDMDRLLSLLLERARAIARKVLEVEGGRRVTLQTDVLVDNFLIKFFCGNLDPKLKARGLPTVAELQNKALTAQDVSALVNELARLAFRSMERERNDSHRRRMTAKRGGNMRQVSLDENILANGTSEDLECVEECLSEMEGGLAKGYLGKDQRQAAKYFRLFLVLQDKSHVAALVWDSLSPAERSKKKPDSFRRQVSRDIEAALAWIQEKIQRSHHAE